MALLFKKLEDDFRRARASVDNAKAKPHLWFPTVKDVEYKIQPKYYKSDNLPSGIVYRAPSVKKYASGVNQATSSTLAYLLANMNNQGQNQAQQQAGRAPAQPPIVREYVDENARGPVPVQQAQVDEEPILERVAADFKNWGVPNKVTDQSEYMEYQQFEHEFLKDSEKRYKDAGKQMPPIKSGEDLYAYTERLRMIAPGLLPSADIYNRIVTYYNAILNYIKYVGPNSKVRTGGKGSIKKADKYISGLINEFSKKLVAPIADDGYNADKFWTAVRVEELKAALDKNLQANELAVAYLGPFNVENTDQPVARSPPPSEAPPKPDMIYTPPPTVDRGDETSRYGPGRVSPPASISTSPAARQSASEAAAASLVSDTDLPTGSGMRFKSRTGSKLASILAKINKYSNSRRSNNLRSNSSSGAGFKVGRYSKRLV